jgi:translocation and assembly module TamA
MRLSLPRIVAAALLMLGAVLPAGAADPQTYRVDIVSTGNGAMDDTLRATSELVSLRSTAPVSPFGLIARARGEVDRLKTVLESYGYYQSAVRITIDGAALNSGGLADTLNALPKGTDAKVAISFELGPLYHLRRVTLDGTIPTSADGAFSLKSGTPAVAADVLAAGSRLLTTLQERGYAFAKVDPPVAYEDQTEPVLDVSFHVDAGAPVKIGEIRLEGLKRVHERLVRQRLTLHSGQQYSPSAIEAARHDLLSLGPFAAISVQVGTAVDSTGGVPITFVFNERKRHAVTLASAYSTDLGGSGGVKWSDRNVFGNAEQLDIAANLINLGGSATTGLGYDTSAKLTFPDFGHRDQSLQLAVGAIKQYLQAYDQKAVTTGATLTRKLSNEWSASVGITAAEEQIYQESVNYNYTLVALPLGLSYDSTHLSSPLDDPVHGMRNSLNVAPTQSLGRPSASFVVSQIKLAGYFDLQHLGFTDPGRTVIAVRALGGLAQGASAFSLPPDQRFYGGGSGTIRGYQYQAVGPRFPDGTPEGGTKIATGTVELRQRFGKNFGAAAFVDGGEVSGFCTLPGATTAQAAGAAKSPPAVTPCRDFRVGIGVGLRYYTPIGPIRFDVAVPTRHYAPIPVTTGGSYNTQDSNFEIYIGLGQAF